MQNAQTGAFCNIFELYKLPFVIKIFILSIFEWPFYKSFTVLAFTRGVVALTDQLLTFMR